MPSQLKKLLTISLFSATAIFIQGCSSTGMMTAGHNGKKYWNPGNCQQYKYYGHDPDKIHCVTNEKENGTILEPVGQQQLENHYRERGISNQSSGNSSNGSTPYNGLNNTVSCYRMGDLSFNKEIRTFSGMVCPLGWFQAF